MESNSTQVKKDGLPINSEEDKIRRNSMKLYIYLVSISEYRGKGRPREFTQRSFSINQIHEILGMHPSTIKKYWRLLEKEGLIKYEGPSMEKLLDSELYEIEMNQDEWNKGFMKRKKFSSYYYTIPKGQQYRIIPKETINKIQTELYVNEEELKLYLLLANMQEHFIFMKTKDRFFSLVDLRDLLGLSKKASNNKNIFKNLLWLKEIGLIDYKEKFEINNLKEKEYYFELINVNYYINKNITEILNANNTKLNQEIKESILNNKTLLIFE